MAAPVVVQHNPGTVSVGTSVACTFGSTPTKGNGCLVFIYHSTLSPNFTIPAGWVLLTSGIQPVSGATVRLYAFIAAGTEGTVTLSGLTSSTYCMDLWEVSGAQCPSAEHTPAATTAAAGSTSLASPTLTNVTDDALLVCAAGIGNTGLPGSSPAWTNSFGGGDSTNRNLATACLIVAARGSTSSTASWTTGGKGVIVAIVLGAADRRSSHRSAPRGATRGLVRGVM